MYGSFVLFITQNECMREYACASCFKRMRKTFMGVRVVPGASLPLALDILEFYRLCLSESFASSLSFET
jgi:hypothetical protein